MVPLISATFSRISFRIRERECVFRLLEHAFSATLRSGAQAPCVRVARRAKLGPIIKLQPGWVRLWLLRSFDDDTVNSFRMC